MCLQNGTTCGQGRVPMYAINATEARHIQVGHYFDIVPSVFLYLLLGWCKFCIAT